MVSVGFFVARATQQSEQTGKGQAQMNRAERRHKKDTTQVPT
jgi:hypothetical protein